MLGKLPVPVRPTYLDCSRAGAYCACDRCGWGLFGHFFLSSVTSLFFLTARYRLKYCLKGPSNPEQPIVENKYRQNVVQYEGRLISVENVRNYLSHIIYILIFDFFLKFPIICQTPDYNIFKILEGGIMVSERQVRFM